MGLVMRGKTMKKVLWLMSAVGLTVTGANAQSGTITIVSANKGISVVDPSSATTQQAMSNEELDRAINGLIVSTQTTNTSTELDSAIDSLIIGSQDSPQFSQSFSTSSNSYLYTTPPSITAQSFGIYSENSYSTSTTLSSSSAPAVAARAASRAARGKSIGRCALYVRKALQSAGYKFTPNPSAYQYAHGTLAGAGFTKINNNNYVPQVGDVVVFNRTSKNPHGHIQIYDGSQWVSDFRQSKFSPYRQHNGYTVWRDTRYLDASANTGTYLALNEQ